MEMTTQQALKQYFGYDSFRGGQEELIAAVLAGRDALGIMPTGAGKSMCFQLPALMLEGITLIVSPLVSLMKDQVGALIQSGVAAAYLNATLTPRQMELALSNARYGKYKLIYVAPERLLVPDFLDFARNAHIAMVTVDEAHCISQWGQDFRPSYTQIPAFLAELPHRPVVSAFTATATAQVQTDIVRLLELQEPKVLVTGFDRENLYFEVQTPKNKMAALTQFLRENSSASGIVYCSTRKTVEMVCTELNAQGFSASRYHAGLPDAERHQNQDDFLFDRVQIMVATNAFGMGIDKSNVSFVVHYNMPKDLESYYQEAGRAGRDGSAARCLLLYSGQDVRTAQWMIENANDMEYPDAQTERLLKERDYQRLREMTFYSTTNDCLRAYILRYFGETPPAYCGSCGNCDTKFELVDVTDDAQKILSCVHRMQGRFGATMVIDVLRGSKNERIAQFGLDTMSTYGVSEKSIHMLRAVLEQLVAEGYLTKSGGQYPVLGLGEKADEILREGKPLQMKLAQEKKPREAASGGKDTAAVAPERRELYTRLRALRAQLAKEQGVPAYVVFTDRSIVDMCARLPQSPAQFTNVQGVGETKRKRYGDVFLQEIVQFSRENGLASAADATGAAEVEQGHREAESPVPARKAGTKKSAQSAVLPGAEVVAQIAISEQPAPVRELAARINEVLKQNGCALVTAPKMTGWLVEQGYLELAESETSNSKTTKRPTACGAQAGILQEERTVRGDTYHINLYPQGVQQLLLDHLDEIICFAAEKRELSGEL